MAFWQRGNSNKALISGDRLVTDFQAAITNLSTAETAKYAAKMSEAETTQILQQLGAGNGLYLTPDDIPDEAKDRLVQDSLDAHIKKVQSEQISAAATQQIAQINLQLNQLYRNKKVLVTSLGGNFQPIDVISFNNKTGQHVTHASHKTIKGYIQEIAVEQNALVLRPSLGTLFLSPDRKNYFVYVINPETLQPAVRISLM